MRPKKRKLEIGNVYSGLATAILVVQKYLEKRDKIDWGEIHQLIERLPENLILNYKGYDLFAGISMLVGEYQIGSEERIRNIVNDEGLNKMIDKYKEVKDIKDIVNNIDELLAA